MTNSKLATTFLYFVRFIWGVFWLFGIVGVINIFWSANQLPQNSSLIYNLYDPATLRLTLLSFFLTAAALWSPDFVRKKLKLGHFWSSQVKFSLNFSAAFCFFLSGLLIAINQNNAYQALPFFVAMALVLIWTYPRLDSAEVGTDLAAYLEKKQAATVTDIKPKTLSNKMLTLVLVIFWFGIFAVAFIKNPPIVPSNSCSAECERMFRMRELRDGMDVNACLKTMCQ